MTGVQTCALPIFLVFKVTYTLYLEVFFRKISIKRSILALVVLKVVGVSGLVYINLIGLGGFVTK